NETIGVANFQNALTLFYGAMVVSVLPGTTTPTSTIGTLTTNGDLTLNLAGPNGENTNTMAGPNALFAGSSVPAIISANINVGGGPTAGLRTWNLPAVNTSQQVASLPYPL